MKKIGLLMTVLLMACSMVMAQGPRGGRNMDPKERAKQTTERMVKDYSLTDTQKEQVQKLNLEMFESMSKITGDDRDARRTKMQTIREDYNKKLKEVLTEEQYNKYVKDEEERRQRMRNR